MLSHCLLFELLCMQGCCFSEFGETMRTAMEWGPLRLGKIEEARLVVYLGKVVINVSDG